MTDLSRRRFLTTAGGVAVACLVPPATTGALAVDGPPIDLDDRRAQAYRLRSETALAHRGATPPAYPTNGDEERHATLVGSYSKALPHDALGLVDGDAYATYVRAVTGGRPADVERIELGGLVKLANPLAAHAFELEGGDPHAFEIAAAPAFGSDEIAGEMTELYWQALTRDVPFDQFDQHPQIAAAARDLSICTAFTGPRANGAVTPATLFRGPTPGDVVGPYVSQFLFLHVPQGNLRLEQLGRVPVAGDDYMTTYPEWLAIQRGLPAARRNVFDPVRRHIRNGRDLGEYVHLDYTYQAFLNAALMLLVMGAPLKRETPYFRRRSRTQSAFVTYGAPHVLDCVARVANAALKACWAQKWLVHRRVRPEAYAGHVHNHLTGATTHPLPACLMDSPALAAVRSTTGTFLLPMAYPEGCPTHPAYPSGHASIAGACTTVLKAFFDEAYVLPAPMIPNADGTTLVAWKGAPLTVGGELNKLASNVAIGRNTAGVHWRTDAVEGMELGEAVTASVLRDLRTTCREEFAGFAWTGFDGDRWMA